MFEYHKDREYPYYSISSCGGFTPLMVDVLNGELTEGNLKKCDINAKNNKGLTALMITCSNAAPKPRGWGLAHLVEPLLKNGAAECINLQDNYGWTALMKSVNYSKAAEILLKYGATPNIQDNYGKTALIYASSFSDNEESIESIELLLKNGTDPNIKTNDGKTALICALQYRGRMSKKTIGLLLKYGANPNIQDNDGKTALIYASVFSNNEESIELLLKNGADPNIKDNDGKTALIFALQHPGSISEKTAEILLKYGADPNIQDNDGKTCLDYSSKHVKKIILNHIRIEKQKRIILVFLGMKDENSSLKILNKDVISVIYNFL